MSSTGSDPRQMADSNEERPGRLEHVEARLVERLAELGLAQVAVVAVAEPLEDRGRHEPAEGAERGAEALRSTRFQKRLDHPRGAGGREDDRVPARLPRPTGPPP